MAQAPIGPNKLILHSTISLGITTSECSTPCLLSKIELIVSTLEEDLFIVAVDRPGLWQ